MAAKSAQGAGTSPRRRRGSLLAADVVTAAIRLIERDGLDQLTMPSLAGEMGAAVTSVYWHFRTKEELVAAVAERVTADLYRSLPSVDRSKAWADATFEYFVNYRQAMVDHRAFLDLFATRSRALFAQPSVGALIIDRLEEEIATIVAAGTNAREAIEIYTALSSYVRGFATLEVFMQREEVSADDRTTIRGQMAGLSAASYPIMSQMVEIEEAMHYDEAQFRFGLRLMIDGVAAHLDRRVAPKPARNRR